MNLLTFGETTEYACALRFSFCSE